MMIIEPECKALYMQSIYKLQGKHYKRDCGIRQVNHRYYGLPVFLLYRKVL